MYNETWVGVELSPLGNFFKGPLKPLKAPKSEKKIFFFDLKWYHITQGIVRKLLLQFFFSIRVHLADWEAKTLKPEVWLSYAYLLCDFHEIKYIMSHEGNWQIQSIKLKSYVEFSPSGNFLKSPKKSKNRPKKLNYFWVYFELKGWNPHVLSMEKTMSKKIIIIKPVLDN